MFQQFCLLLDFWFKVAGWLDVISDFYLLAGEWWNVIGFMHIV